MSHVGGWPAMIGKIGSTPISGLADKVLAYAPKKSAIAVMLDSAGVIWLDRPADANEREMVGTYTHKSDPDYLAEDIRFEARCRGLM